MKKGSERVKGTKEKKIFCLLSYFFKMLHEQTFCVCRYIFVFAIFFAEKKDFVDYFL